MSADAERPRRPLVYALVVGATLVCVLAIMAVWVQRQALNTDNWTRSSSELLEDPAVRSVLAAYLVDQLYANVDVEAELREALPPRARPLAGPAAGGLRRLADDVADKALQRPRVQALWEAANRRAHRRLMQVLEGGGPALQTTGGVVTLDVGGLLQQIADRTGVGARLADKVKPGSTEIVLLRSDQLARAQNIVNGLRPLAIVLVALALGLYGLAIGLARGWRRQALRAAGIGLVVAGISALIVRRVAGVEIVDALASTAAVGPAVASTWRIETSLLVDAAQATIAYGVVAVLAAWLAGPTRPAVAARQALAPYLREPAMAYGGLAVIVLLLLAWAPTQALRQPITAVLLVAIVAAGFEALRRQAAREFPDAERRAFTLRVPAALGRAGAGGNSARTPPATPGDGTAAAAAPDPGTQIDQIERIAALHDRGVISDDEFTAQKRAILSAR